MPEMFRDFRETGPRGLFLKVPKLFGWCVQNEGVPCHETLQLFQFLFSLQHVKRPALQNKRPGRSFRNAFRAGKVFGSLDKHTPGLFVDNSDYYLQSKTVHNSQVPHHNSSSSLLNER